MTVAALRPPDGRQGPGPMPGALLRMLDLALVRRAGGTLPGDHLAPGAGTGTELVQLRPYQVGDDVRQIDAAATARTGVPHVRLQVPERTLTTWLVIDVSPSMAFGTAQRLKADVAEGVAIAVARLATRRGGRAGLLRAGAGGRAAAAAARRPPRAARDRARGARGRGRRCRRDPERPLPARWCGPAAWRAARGWSSWSRISGRTAGARRSPRSARGTAWWRSRCATRARPRCRAPATSRSSTPRPAPSSRWTVRARACASGTPRSRPSGASRWPPTSAPPAPTTSSSTPATTGSEPSAAGSTSAASRAVPPRPRDLPSRRPAEAAR